MGGVTREYYFFDVPEESGYLTAFPLNGIKEKISDEQIKSIKLEYRIFTSIADAELAMVELLEMSSLYMHNIMDVPLPNGQIGDNCWHQLAVGAIHFIRNNILVSITPNSFDSSGDFSFIEVIARKIDSVIVNSEKVYDATLIPVPEIHEIQITSSLPQNWEDPVTIKIDASDPKGGKLFFRKYATGFGLVSEDGILTFLLDKKADSMEESNKAKVKIWVWNEDNYITSVEHEIPF